MSAARYFYKAFTPKKLNQIYEEKIQYRVSAGLDSIAPKVFEARLFDNIQRAHNGKELFFVLLLHGC